MGTVGDPKQRAQRAHRVCGGCTVGMMELVQKAAREDERDEVRAADMKKDSVLPEENTAILKIFKDRTCVQDEEISEAKHRWLLSSSLNSC